MFFFLQPTSTKILPFKSTDFLDREPLPKLSDIKTQCCMYCGKYGSRRNDGFIIYERLYVGRPDITINKRRFKDYEDIDICRECYAELCPELAKFIQ